MKTVQVNTQTDCQLSVGLSTPKKIENSSVVLIMEDEDPSPYKGKTKETIAVLSLEDVSVLIDYLNELKKFLEEEDEFNRILNDKYQD